MGKRKRPLTNAEDLTLEGQQKKLKDKNEEIANHAVKSAKRLKHLTEERDEFQRVVDGMMAGTTPSTSQGQRQQTMVKGPDHGGKEVRTYTYVLSEMGCAAPAAVATDNAVLSLSESGNNTALTGLSHGRPHNSPTAFSAEPTTSTTPLTTSEQVLLQHEGITNLSESDGENRSNKLSSDLHLKPVPSVPSDLKNVVCGCDCEACCKCIKKQTCG